MEKNPYQAIGFHNSIGLIFFITVFTNAQMATQTFVTDLQAMNPTVVQVQVRTLLHASL